MMRTNNRQTGYFLVAVTVCLTLAGPTLAHADISSVLTNIQTMLTGTVAKTLAILAVMLTGFAWMFGMMDLRKAAMVVFGIALVFGAADIVSQISGA